MCDNLAAVRAGLTRFVNNLRSNEDIDFRMAVLLIGHEPEWITPWTTDANFIIWAFGNTTCGSYSSTSWHGPHYSYEPSLEVMRMVHRKAPVSNLKLGPKVPSGSDMTLREGALAYHILVTDEDSDSAHHSANRFPGQSSREPPQPFQKTNSNGF